MRNRRTAVLGGSGFIGRYVVKRLAARGEVIAVGCRNAEAAKFLKPLGDVGQIVPLNVGIGDEALLPAFLSGNDSLVNSVGILRETGAQTFELVHHTGPARLARFAREAEVERFVHISAIGADLRSFSAYARTKAAGEQAVRDAFPTVTILRPSVVFGPEDQFFNRFAAMATIYELGGPKIYSFREVLELVQGEIRRKRRFVDLPFGLAAFQAKLMSILPNPPLTPDQVELLKSDNIVSSGALTLASLGITPTPAEVVLPTYLDRFRRGGWYAGGSRA